MIRVSETASANSAGSSARPGASSLHQRRHERQRERQQDDLDDEQQREQPVREAGGRGLPALLGDPRIGGDIGLVERALPEDGAEMVGQAQRHREGVHHRAGAEHGGEHDVAREAGKAREQRVAADRQDFAKHCVLDLEPDAFRWNRVAVPSES